MTKWSDHVKKHAKKHKMSYREASMDSKCKESYRKKRMSPRKMSKKRMSPRKMSKKRMSPRKMSKKRMNGFEEYVDSDYYAMSSGSRKDVIDRVIEVGAKKANREEYVDGSVGDEIRQYVAKIRFDTGHFPDADQVKDKFIELTK